MSREDTASPTVALESINLTFAIDAHEERDVMITDVPNAFVQTNMPPEMLCEGNRTIMKLREFWWIFCIQWTLWNMENI